MITTKPNYINGDQITLRVHFASFFNDDYPIYSSLFIWWKKNTLLWSIPFGFTSLLIFFSLVFQGLYYHKTFHLLPLVGMSLQVFVYFMPLVWIVSYYYAFVLPKKVGTKLHSFINKNLPGATKVRSLSLNNYLFTWNNREYELAYSLIPCVNSEGKVTRRREGVILCMRYTFDAKYKSEILDENGKLNNSLLQRWNDYCRDKESCKGLVLDLFSMYSVRRADEAFTPEEVQNTLEQMKYLADKFHLTLLDSAFSIKHAIKKWLNMIDFPISEDIVALNIGIFESESRLSLRLTGSKQYDAEDDSWACNEDFIPCREYLKLVDVDITQDNWNEMLQLAKTAVGDYVSAHTEDIASLFYHKVVTLEFDDGNLERIL